MGLTVPQVEALVAGYEFTGLLGQVFGAAFGSRPTVELAPTISRGVTFDQQRVCYRTVLPDSQTGRPTPLTWRFNVDESWDEAAFHHHFRLWARSIVMHEFNEGFWHLGRRVRPVHGTDEPRVASTEPGGAG